jgi:hypothetical protein
MWQKILKIIGKFVAAQMYIKKTRKTSTLQCKNPLKTEKEMQTKLKTREKKNNNLNGNK